MSYFVGRKGAQVWSPQGALGVEGARAWFTSLSVTSGGGGGGGGGDTLRLFPQANSVRMFPVNSSRKFPTT